MKKHKEDFCELFSDYNKKAKALVIDVDKLRSGQLLNAMRDDYEFFMNVINLFISRCKNCSQNQ